MAKVQKNLKLIASWLKECEVTTVAMESTGVYWIPLFGVLKDIFRKRWSK